LKTRRVLYAQPVVMEYVIDQLIEQVCEEIATKDVLDPNARTEAFRLEQSSRQSSQKIIRFNRHALIKAQEIYKRKFA